MSYGFSAMDVQLAATEAAARAVWEAETYMDTSRPASDRASRKWQIVDALFDVNAALVCPDPAPDSESSGFFGRLKSGTRPSLKCLLASLPMADDELELLIYDQAVDFELPFELPLEQAEAAMREAWRLLRACGQMGLSTVYDTEREVLLNLDTDFDAVMQRFVENLREFSDDDTPTSAAPETVDQPAQAALTVSAAPVQTPVTEFPAVPTSGSTPDRLDHQAFRNETRRASPPLSSANSEPFTGNVSEPKPWWKFW